jgi:hypothetical protein
MTDKRKNKNQSVFASLISTNRELPVQPYKPLTYTDQDVDSSPTN